MSEITSESAALATVVLCSRLGLTPSTATAQDIVYKLVGLIVDGCGLDKVLDDRLRLRDELDKTRKDLGYALAGWQKARDAVGTMSELLLEANAQRDRAKAQLASQPRAIADWIEQNAEHLSPPLSIALEQAADEIRDGRWSQEPDARAVTCDVDCIGCGRTILTGSSARLYNEGYVHADGCPPREAPRG